MRKKYVRITAISLLSVILLLGVTLAIHLYVVKKHPKAVNETTLALARIDFQQTIDVKDANIISEWLKEQTGVTQVLCNQTSGIAVFSYYPLKANADQLVAQLKSTLHYKAQRFVPDEKSLKSGCPAGF